MEFRLLHVAADQTRCTNPEAENLSCTSLAGRHRRLVGAWVFIIGHSHTAALIRSHYAVQAISHNTHVNYPGLHGSPGEVPWFMVVPSDHRGRPVLRGSPVVAPWSSREPCSSSCRLVVVRKCTVVSWSPPCGRPEVHGRPGGRPVGSLWPSRSPWSSRGRPWSMGVRLSVIRCGRTAVAKMSSRGRSVFALGSQCCFGPWLSSALPSHMVVLCSVTLQAVLR